MIERVNPSHPDKIADRIAGAIVDLAYKKQDNPKIAVEVLIGHGECHIITETSVGFTIEQIENIVRRITGEDANSIYVDYTEEAQDAHLAANQADKIKCGDNGIFKGVPMNDEENNLLQITHELYHYFPTDGKFIYDQATATFIACQSCVSTDKLTKTIAECLESRELPSTFIIANPLGEWTGGPNVDTGATNRKLGSDMGRAVTGGGLHGKDLSKADVSVNIACHILAQQNNCEVSALCAIGDETIHFNVGNESAFMDYAGVVQMAREYIERLGGFEKLACWGLI